VAGGVASLDGSGLVPSAQLPSFVDDVIEAANFAAFPGTGESSKIYVALDTNRTYRWSGSAYVEISASPGSTDSVTEGSVNLYYTNTRADARIAAAVGSTLQAYGADLTVIEALTPSDDDVLQRKSGAWANRTLAQLRTDLLVPSDTVTALADKQPLDTDLTTFAAIAASNVSLYRSGIGWTTYASSVLGRTLGGIADAAAGRTAIDIGQQAAFTFVSDVYTITLTTDPIQSVTLGNWTTGTKTITTTGSKSEGGILRIVIGAHATNTRAITWNAIFVAGSGLTLPATSLVAKKQWCDFVWDDTDSKLVMIRSVARA
jgi:hypothetical protein